MVGELLISDVASCNVHTVFMNVSSAMNSYSGLPDTAPVINTFAVLFGQYGLAMAPESAQISSEIWWSQLSVGTVSLSKYSVVSIDPRGSLSHIPTKGRSPDLLHTVAFVMPSGCTKSLASSPSWILLMAFFHIFLG